MTIASTPRAAGQLRVRTRLVATDADLLPLLPGAEGALAWLLGGDGLVGWGEAARYEPSGPDRFALADTWWQRFSADLVVQDELRLPGSGPVAFVSMAFADDPGDSVIVVPRVIVGRRDGLTWITEIGGSGRNGELPVQQVQPVSRPTRVRYSDGQLPVAGYRDAVRRAVRRMRDGELRKVVLAHDLTVTAETKFDPRFLLHGLAARYPTCWVFAVDGLVGATPELLLRREGSTVSSRVLAGTSWPRNGTSPTQLAARLLGSAKDREEHRYAVESLADTLRPFCSRLSVPSSPEVLPLRNVLHLCTDILGTLRGSATLLRLAEALHPTAAVGGTPRSEGMALIRELEGMDRGRYAGPVGWIDGTGDGELGIAIRCAQVAGTEVRLFAGCGIVEDSEPDDEVAEAAAKLVPMRDAIEGLEG